MGDKFREGMEGGEGMKRFSVHFIVRTPLQIVFLDNLKNCRSPSKIKPCTMSDTEMSKKN